MIGGVLDLYAAIPEYLKYYGFIAGGALRALYDGTPIKDIDLFFQSEEDYLEARREAQNDPELTCVGEAGRTFMFRTKDGMYVNLVGFAFGTPEETIERFDFRCCRIACAFDSGFHLNPMWFADCEAISDALTKRLVVLQNNGDERTERRIRHYVEDYGYTLDTSVSYHLVPEDQVEDDPQRPVAVTEVQRYIRRLPRHNALGY